MELGEALSRISLRFKSESAPNNRLEQTEITYEEFLAIINYFQYVAQTLEEIEDLRDENEKLRKENCELYGRVNELEELLDDIQDN